MQCKEFVFVLEQEDLSSLPDAAQAHLAACADCQSLLADFSSIVAAAKHLPAEVDPPQRVWVNLRSQLEAEGLIKEPSVVLPQTSTTWQQNVRAWFSVRALTAAGVGVALAFAAFLQLHRPVAISNLAVPVAQKQLQPEVPREVPKETPAQVVLQQVKPPVSLPIQPRQTSSPALAVQVETPALAPSPSEDVYFARSAALNQAENDVPTSRLAANPALDEALRKNLKTVNAFIAECEAHLKKHPQDTLAREYLNSAYQQKAELLAAMLDSGRSEQ
jgi:hypothetical protein